MDAGKVVSVSKLSDELRILPAGFRWKEENGNVAIIHEERVIDEESVATFTEERAHEMKKEANRQFFRWEP